MKIIILGATQIGLELAHYLVTAGHAVTLVDSSPEALNQIGTRLDLRTVLGNPSSPSALREAGAENTELLVAATSDDETNITACCVGQFLFSIPTKIARIRSIEYLGEQALLFGQHAIPIDRVIAPESLITENIIDLISLPGAIAVAPFFDGRVMVVCARCAIGGRLLGHKVSEFTQSDPHAAVLALYRDNKFLPLSSETVFRPADEVFFCCARSRALSQLALLINLEVGGRHVTIAGGTHIADELARRLSERYAVKLIEPDPARAQRISATRLHGTGVKVFNADPASREFMLEEHVHHSDLFVAAAAADETNIMAALMLSRLHHVRTLAVIRGESYFDLARSSSSDINTIISPNESTISALLGQIRQEGVVDVHMFRQGRAEVLELKVHGSPSSSGVIGRSVSSLNLPEGARLGLVLRDDQLLPATPELSFRDEDRLIVYLADHALMRRVVRLFSARPFWMPKWS